MRYRGGQGADWREVMRIRMGPGAHGYDEPLPGQKLPKGFLFGDPSKQSFGMGGPQLVFGPLEKVCRDCKEPFVFPATSQKQLLEEDGAFIDTTAVRCLPCARRRSKIESARRAHAVALDALAEGAPAGSYLAAGRAALALLEAGGSLKIDRAISHCRKAQKLGARSAAGIEAKLIELRAARQLESKS